ncbi:MAG: hypothetical protein LBL04_09820 [Bacteroidales bacterium]|nr:hypothetical protein [Bacteroidales bacterium]
MIRNTDKRHADGVPAAADGTVLIGELDADGYGIMLFSPDLFNEYIRINKWRARKYITFFNNNREKFFQIIKDGIPAPFYLLPKFQYNIFVKVNAANDEIPGGYRKMFQYNRFYMEIGKNNKLCIASFAFMENSVELIEQNITEKSESVPTGPEEIMEQYNYAFRVELESGKYYFNLIGLEKINKGERESKNYGYLFEFIKDGNAINDNFNKCDNDQYIFDIMQYKL